MPNMNTNYLDSVNTSKGPLVQKICYAKIRPMKPDRARPYLDIAERLFWHRSLEGLGQAEYGALIGATKSRYSNWESGASRLSLDGALALRDVHGLSLDFLYMGDDEALPMTLRKAWRSKPAVKS